MFFLRSNVVSFALDSTFRKPVVVDNTVQIRKIKHISVNFNHNLVDGAPHTISQHVQRLCGKISTINHGPVRSFVLLIFHTWNTPHLFPVKLINKRFLASELINSRNSATRKSTVLLQYKDEDCHTKPGFCIKKCIPSTLYSVLRDPSALFMTVAIL
jgi:hypothetical protein